MIKKDEYFFKIINFTAFAGVMYSLIAITTKPLEVKKHLP